MKNLPTVEVCLEDGSNRRIINEKDLDQHRMRGYGLYADLGKPTFHTDAYLKQLELDEADRAAKDIEQDEADKADEAASGSRGDTEDDFDDLDDPEDD